MSITDIIWIFFIIISLWPAIQKVMLEQARLRVMRQMEQKRGSRVIALIHRQETMALLGFPLVRYIDIEDSEQILRVIKLTDDEIPIDLILHTPGGLVLAAEQIAHALCRRAGRVTVFVPHYAMSGGTLLALAADEIVMDENAVLGPVDPQIGDKPAASVLSVLTQKSVNEIDDDTLILADVARKAINQTQHAVAEILSQSDQMAEAKARELAKLLTAGTWTHDYPISVEEARDLGLPISTAMPEEVYNLMALYRQPSARRPSVSYVPIPYQRRDGTKTP